MHIIRALGLLLILTGIVDAREVKIRSADKSISASIVPAKNWCSMVVSAEIRASKDALLKEPEQVQKLIFGTQIAAVADCRQAELLRVRGVSKGDSIFLGYVEKQDNWSSITLVEGDQDVLAVLKIDKTKEANIRKIALWETKTHFSRIGIQGVEYELENNDAEDVRMNWKLLSIQGSTFVILDRRNKFQSLGMAANTFGDAAMAECDAVANLSQDSLKSGIEVRAFDCLKGEVANSHMLLLAESGDLGRIFHTRAATRADLIQLNQLLADGAVLY